MKTILTYFTPAALALLIALFCKWENVLAAAATIIFMALAIGCVMLIADAKKILK